MAYQYNAANALTLMTPPTGQPTKSSYDTNGNLTLENTGGAFTTYSWDEGRASAALSRPREPPSECCGSERCRDLRLLGGRSASAQAVGSDDELVRVG